jgi:acetolactate synthase-1/2/3 large subunit
MLTETSDVIDAVPVRTSQAYPDPKSIRAFSEKLQASERPMLIVGGGGWDTTAVENLKVFAERTKIPIVTSFRRQDYFDNTHSSFAGYLGIGVNPKLAQRVQDADLLIVLGARLGEVPTSGYSLLKIPVPDQSLVHVHADPEELGRVYQAQLPINADPRAMAAVLQDVSVGDGARRWADWLKDANNDCQTYSRPIKTPGNLQMSEVMAHLQKVLPENAIITNGAGNYTAWIHRFYRYRQYGTQLAPTAGSMGYGVPASVAAKLRMPEREVIAFAGDGCFLMNGQEFATAVQYGANIVCIVVNNSMLGTIRMHQERHYPGRVSNTGLINPDFASYAEAFGGYGEVVECTEEFPAALQRARDSAKPAILELRVDPEALTPGKSLSEIRGSSL